MARSSIPKLDDLNATDLTNLISRAQQLREERKQSEKTRLLEQFRKMAADAGFTFEEIIGRGASGRRKRSDAGVKLKPNFVGPNGETYTGRGPTPKWLKDLEAKGHKRDRYLVK
ncbi:MAG: H-NS histone family protein [Hyphomonadaceae bacterium]